MIKIKTEQQLKPSRVGILGGTFDPIHHGHLFIAEQVYQRLNLDEVWLLPDNQPPHIDQKNPVAVTERITMVQKAIENNPHLKLALDEVLRGGKSYTIDTILAFQEQYPETEFYFIIGADMVAYLPKWYRIDELVQLVNFFGVYRSGYPKETKYPVQWVELPLLEISSSQIREYCSQERSIRYLVPDQVAAYIAEKRLYANDKD